MSRHTSTNPLLRQRVAVPCVHGLAVLVAWRVAAPCPEDKCSVRRTTASASQKGRMSHTGQGTATTSFYEPWAAAQSRRRSCPHVQASQAARIIGMHGRMRPNSHLDIAAMPPRGATPTTRCVPWRGFMWRAPNRVGWGSTLQKNGTTLHYKSQVADT